jgi:hypothetical protein
MTKNEIYYHTQAALIQAAATLAAGMPQPAEKDKDKLVEIYSERFSMAYRELSKWADEAFEGFVPFHQIQDAEE